MNYFKTKSKKSTVSRILSLLNIAAFLINTLAPSSLVFAQPAPQTILNLPPPGTMFTTSPEFTPALLKGVTLDMQNPLKFDFIVDTGNTKIEGDTLKEESKKLIKYFLASLTVPEKDLWVNLSPYEKDRIIPVEFGKTEMGRDLLAQDYLLKQLTASLVYPEDELGKKFWDRVYKRAQALYGTTNIPVNTFNKVWIVPDKAVIYENGGTAYVLESHLKVMLEEDYLALNKNLDNKNLGITQVAQKDAKVLNQVSSQVVREVLIPEIEKEVNQGKNFINLRQIYYSMILAAWYKKNLKESLLGQVYINQNKIKGVESRDMDAKQKIYEQYLAAFKKGVYDYIKEESDPQSGKAIERRYISGGVTAANVIQLTNDGDDFKDVPVSALPPAYQANLSATGLTEKVTVALVENPPADTALLTTTGVQNMANDFLTSYRQHGIDYTVDVKPSGANIILTIMQDRNSNPLLPNAQDLGNRFLKLGAKLTPLPSDPDDKAYVSKFELSPAGTSDQAILASDAQTVVSDFLKHDLTVEYKYGLKAEASGNDTIVSIIQTNRISPPLLPLTIINNFQALASKFPGSNLAFLPSDDFYTLKFKITEAINHPPEPFKIKVVEPVGLVSPAKRQAVAREVGNNIFNIPAEDIYIDLLTDSGTGAISQDQLAASMRGDESYAQSRSFERFKNTIKEVLGFDYVLPTHQGRGAENVLNGELLAGEKKKVIGNRFFDTTSGWISMNGGQEVELPIKESMDTSIPYDFKGNIDVEGLRQELQKNSNRVAYILMTVTDNTGAGQPVSMANLKAVRKLADEFKVPFFGDIARFAENAMFIKMREAGYADKSIPDIATEMMSLFDAVQMSAKKDTFSPIGGFLAMRNKSLYDQLSAAVIAKEGYITYGGLSGANIEIMNVGVREVLDENYLRYRLGQVRYLGEKLKEAGVPVVEPIGGHAVYVDAKRFLPHIPPSQFPAQALAMALYEEGGIRGVEIGSFLKGRYPPGFDKQGERGSDFELLRLTIPRRVYTQSHMDYVVNVLKELYAKRDQIRGLQIDGSPIESPLRHFQQKLKPMGGDSALLAGVLPRVNPTMALSWRPLKAQARSSFDLRTLFAQDPNRADRFLKVLNSGFEVDFSKNLIDTTTLKLLTSLADESGLKKAINQMFTGEKINETEKRAVLHTALRNVKRDQGGKLVAANGPVFVDGKDVMPGVISVLKKMEGFTKKVQSSEWKGYSGKRIKNIVNVGIGGSDLGPKMAVEALKPYKAGEIDAYYLSNIDGTAAADLMKKLDPEETLVIVVSKTFTTQETMQNATTLKNWVLQHYKGNQDVVKSHFVAVSTAEKLITDFGIAKDNMFEFWDWVGGRYSVWSAVGLSLATYIGFDNFLEFLQGGREMDEHFKNEPFENNIPVLKGLLDVWYGNMLGAKSSAILPYDQHLNLLPAFSQQFFMESLGKRVDRDGNPVNYPTGLVVFGAAGTDGQHSFYQLIHQAPEQTVIPSDFIGVLKSHNSLPGHHDKFFSNFVAQTEALAFGLKTEEVLASLKQDPKNAQADPAWLDFLAQNKTFPGNKPTTSILIDKVSPRTLGSLVAMYEHQIFVEGMIWNINPYDQMGVEEGKRVATQKVLPSLSNINQLGASGLSTSASRAVNKYVQANLKASDSAILSDKEVNVGGINLDPSKLDLQIKRDGNGVPLPINQQPIPNMRIDGFSPVIINISPIPDLPLLFGAVIQEHKPTT